MSNNKKTIIKTSDEHTADILRKSGFPELSMEQGKWVFANVIGKIDFSKENLKINFDNKLCI